MFPIIVRRWHYSPNNYKSGPSSLISICDFVSYLS